MFATAIMIITSSCHVLYTEDLVSLCDAAASLISFSAVRTPSSSSSSSLSLVFRGWDVRLSATSVSEYDCESPVKRKLSVAAAESLSLKDIFIETRTIMSVGVMPWPNPHYQ